MQKLPLKALKSWFNREKRSLPWRQNPTGYRVLVSEVMLQQTQASVVEPYFIRWMERFPTLEALAEVDETTLLKAWEGLGYYSRAKNLQKAAKKVMEHYQGIIPEKVEELKALPGIGPYTAAAIAAFAFKKKAIPIDGNVLRVASRLFLIEDPINTTSGYKKVEEHLASWLEDKEPWVVGEALIELGATLCMKVPKCGRCPLQLSCIAYQKGLQTTLPKKLKPQKTIKLEREVLVLQYKEEILVKKNLGKGLMQDLYEFPYFEKENAEIKIFTWQAKLEKSLSPLIQSFTRFRVTLYPSLWKVEDKKNFETFEWIDMQRAKSLPFSSAHKKILSAIEFITP